MDKKKTSKKKTSKKKTADKEEALSPGGVRVRKRTPKKKKTTYSVT